MVTGLIPHNSDRKKKTENRKQSIILLLVLLAGLAGGCGPASKGSIIVFASPDSPRLRQVVAGLEAGLGQGPLTVVCVPEFGPEGEEALRRVRRGRPRLLIVLGTAALLRVAPKEKRTPVIFAMVANPYFTGVAYDPQHPEIHQENATGIASPAPLAAALEQGARLLGPNPWGLLYDPRDGVAVESARQFTELAPPYGLTPLLEESRDAAQDGPGLERLLARGAKVLYLPPTATAARYAPQVLALGREQKAMVVSSLPEGPRQGALLWVALDYRRIGEEAAALAQRVLAGEPPAKIPIMEKSPLQIEVDETLLRRWSGYPPKK